GLDRRRRLDPLEAGAAEQLGERPADAGVPAFAREERAVRGEEVIPPGRAWHEGPGLTVVVLDGQDAAGLERADEPTQVGLGTRQEEENPAREDDVVAGAGQGGLGEVLFPDPAFPEAVPPAKRAQPLGERGRALDRVHGSANAPPQLQVQRALAR